MVGAGFTDNMLFKTGNLYKPALFPELLISASESPLQENQRCFKVIDALRRSRSRPTPLTSPPKALTLSTVPV